MIQPTPGETKGLELVTRYDGLFRLGLLNNRAGKTLASRMHRYSFYQSFYVILSWTWIGYKLVLISQ